METIAKEFGKYLRSIRKEKGLTLVELKNETSISQPYLSQLENGLKGIPSPETLKKLAGPLGVSHNELMVQAGHIEKSDILDELEKLKESEGLRFKSNVTKSLKYILDVLSDGERFYGTSSEQVELIQTFCKERFGEDFILSPSSLIELFLKVDWTKVNVKKEEQGEFNRNVFELFGILEIWADHTQDRMNDLSHIIEEENINYQGLSLTDVDRKVIKNFLHALFFDRLHQVN